MIPMFYSLILPSLVVLTILFILYLSRSRLLPLLPQNLQDRLPPFLTSNSAQGGPSYSRLPGFDWVSNQRAGLNSTLFDIEANIRDGDSRSGLDPRGSNAVHTLMERHGLTFDEARLRYLQDTLRNNNVDPLTGIPLDSKAITSLGPR